MHLAAKNGKKRLIFELERAIAMLQEVILNSCLRI